MKIIQVGSFPLDATCIKGGVEASVYGLTMEQAKTNQLFVFDVPRSEIKKDYMEEIEGITVYRFFSKGSKNFSAIFRLKSIVKIICQLKPDICHIHATSQFSFITYLLFRLYRIPAIVTVHGLIHIEKQNAWRKQHSLKNLIKYCTQSLTEFIFLSICRTVIVDTQYVADAIKLYKKQGKIMGMPVCNVIPQGVNDVFFQLENESKSKYLLSVGAISKRKGHLLLVDAMEKVRFQFPDFSLTIVGALSDKLYYQSMQNSIKEKGLEHTVQIYPNALFENILNFYKKAEIFVLHSEEESQGIVFCEAMAAGKPIVATNVGGVPWVIENKVNGLLSDFGDVDTFVNNIISLLENENLRRKMEEANRIQSLKYNWKYIADEIMVIYKSLLSNKTPPNFSR